MARAIANVDILTETFEAWLLKTNSLLDAMSLEIITANTTLGITGNTTAPRLAELVGTFGANVVIATGNIRGGNVTTSGNLSIVSNTIMSGGYINVSSNASFSNTSWFTANVSMTGGRLTTTSNASIINSNTYVQSNTISLNANSTIAAIAVRANTLTTNTTIAGNLVTISANAVITGTAHTVAGNVAFDTSTLVVDALNNRVGIANLAPDATLSVTGTANVSGDARLGGMITVLGNSSISNTLLQVTSNTTANVVTIGAANVSVDSGVLFVDSINNRIGVNGTAPDASLAVTGTANVSGAVRLASTLTAVGAATFSNTIAVTGAATLSNTLSVTNTATFSNTIAVTGAATLSSTMNVVGAANLQSSANVGTTLGVVGAVTLSNTIAAAGLATFNAAMNTTTANASVGMNIGANVNMTTSSMFIGNTTINNFSNSSISQIGGAAGLTTNSTALVVGAAVVNTTVLTIGTGNFSVGANVGANVNLTTSTIKVGNSTVNAVVNSSSVYVTGTGAAISVGGTLVVGTTLASGNATHTGFVNVSTTAQVTGATTLSNTLSVAGNVTISSVGAHTIAGNVAFATSTLFVDSVANRVGIGNGAPNATLQVTGTANVSGVTTFAANVGITGNLTLTGSFIQTGGAGFGNTTITGWANVTQQANIGGVLTVTGNTTLTGNVTTSGGMAVGTTLTAGNTNISGNVGVTQVVTANVLNANTLTLSGTASITGNTSIAGLVTIDTDYVIDVVSNTNVGVPLTPIPIFSFPKATYSTAKLQVQIKNTGNTQMSEVIIAHDLTTAYITVYGTVSSPPSGNSSPLLGSFTTTINSTSSMVELLLTQTIASSATKVVAHLIK